MRGFSPALAALLLASAVPGRVPASGEGEPLPRALAVVRPEALRADLHFLAADELGGRDTPSPELRVAALYLRARLERLGFQTTGPEGWFHDYELYERGLDLERSGLTLTLADRTEHLVFGEDYFLARVSHLRDGLHEGRVTSVGSGTRDEFEASELEGRWALLFDKGVALRRTQRYAQKRGAIGVLFVRSPQSADGKEPYAERFAATTNLVSQPRVSNRPAQGTRDEDEPAVVMLTPKAAAVLLALVETPPSAPVPPAGKQLDVTVREERVVGRRTLLVPNVAGFWPGSDPELAHEVLIVSAHFDHVGRRQDEIYNGADDNGSGTTGLLGVAEALAAYGPMRRSVLLLWVSGEEKGLWGSAAWTKNPRLPEGCRPVANLNMDMIGRTAPDELYLTPTSEHDSYNSVSRAAYELAPLEGFPELRSQDRDWARSDHMNFDRNLGIPVAFLSAGEHPDYHEPTDTADKIDYEKMARITRLVVRLLDRLQDEPLEYLEGR